jgi:hypothetical protein
LPRPRQRIWPMFARRFPRGAGSSAAARPTRAKDALMTTTVARVIVAIQAAYWTLTLYFETIRALVAPRILSSSFQQTSSQPWSLVAKVLQHRLTMRKPPAARCLVGF